MKTESAYQPYTPLEAAVALERLGATFPAFVFGYQTDTGMQSTGISGDAADALQMATYLKRTATEMVEEDLESEDDEDSEDQ